MPNALAAFTYQKGVLHVRAGLGVREQRRQALVEPDAREQRRLAERYALGGRAVARA